MARRILQGAVFSLACFLIQVESQSLTTRTFPHVAPVTGAMPRNLKIDPALKSSLEMEVPADFETVVLKEKYKFNDREHLVKALLHESYKAKVSKTMKDSYQPLDQIGTMVVDYMFTRHLILNMVTVNGKQLATMKNVMAGAPTISFVALKNNFEKYIHIDPKLSNSSQSMNDFRSAVDDNELYQDLVRKEPIAAKRPAPASYVARMFKAMIGAIYVDSGYSMEATEAAIMPLFKKELDRVISKVTARNQPVS